MTHPLSPSAVLPALNTLRACNTASIENALQALRDVYFPQTSPPASLSISMRALRPKRRARLHDLIPDSGYASAEEDYDRDEIEALEILRSDDFERSYAIKWLTGLIKRGDVWVDALPSSSTERTLRTAYVEDASCLLARFAGDEPEQALTRTFAFTLRVPSCDHCYQESSSQIMVELNDAPVDGTDHTAVGLQSWASAIVFAERICLDPERYLGGLHKMRPRRVLELGAGTGLLSITAAQIFSRMNVQSEIKATDYHPSVLNNLLHNVTRNLEGVNALVSVEDLDWCKVAHSGEKIAQGDDAYDVVLAADVVYHPEHANWIKGCVERTLRKSGVFWLVIPVRTIGRHAGLAGTVEAAFPVVGGVKEGEGECLAIVSRDEVQRVSGVGRADERGYRLFEIRWV